MKPALLLALLIATTSASYGQDGPNLRYDVGLNVSCDDTSLRTRIESLLSRGLRSLDDVVVVSLDRARYELAVVAIQDRNPNGSAIGHSISLVIYDHYPQRSAEYLRNTLSRYQSQMEADTTWFVTQINLDDLSDVSRIRAHRLLVGGSNALDTQLRGILDYFDAEILEPNRRLAQEFWDRTQ